MIKRLASVGLLIGMAACGRATPSQDYRTGAVLVEETFDTPFAWETYTDPATDTYLRVENGAYRMQTGAGRYIWGLNAERHDDVAFEAQTAQLSTDPNNAFGLICRASPSNTGDGYYFFISGDGYWSIRRRTADSVDALVPFTKTDAINEGQSINTIRALCIGDYLALYVNDRFVGETRDDTYDHGFAGFAVAASPESPVDVTFDNARIVEARLVDGD